MLVPLKWICYFKYKSQKFNWLIQIDLFDKLTLFRLYKKHVKKKTEKNKIKYRNTLKME